MLKIAYETSIYKNAKTHNVYHRCLCLIKEQVSIDTILVLLNFFTHEKVNE